MVGVERVESRERIGTPAGRPAHGGARREASRADRAAISEVHDADVLSRDRGRRSAGSVRAGRRLPHRLLGRGRRPTGRPGSRRIVRWFGEQRRGYGPMEPLPGRQPHLPIDCGGGRARTRPSHRWSLRATRQGGGFDPRGTRGSDRGGAAPRPAAARCALGRRGRPGFPQASAGFGRFGAHVVQDGESIDSTALGRSASGGFIIGRGAAGRHGRRVGASCSKEAESPHTGGLHP